ncbi:bifunctional TVP38/TMEM64 family protein/FAD-dependent oxidoreductase [Cocleimonas flava]|uniref:Pyruvate/2-oxoglutarate dehydrogenase complex dihydrolipoamide dehydrogenase (E3) component n=1 Tax=Cocleimonas flava TaxID=634765 RepID=A0A4R1F3D2_9GAMM|nr:bifunctional TVP38/TMEM64 family protein/FAD-dependent oxidoreductase [Cocleimonas flava]TCJ87054.1 pyruvate/2-oxoglutarate dehydrogenase complex dihydrolipoamide dehydrogenase (E3) component [Cocleimonas flava]
MNKKIIIVALIVSIIAAFFLFDLKQYLSLDYIKSQQSAFQAFYADNTFLTLLIFFVTYVVIAALSLPGAAIMTILAGTLFGLVTGTIMVSFASTLGATLAFLATRYLLQDTMESRYTEKLKSVNAGIEKEGPFYLFAMRLVPIFPFFLINIVMGLTKIPTLTFALVSQVGMLAGTIAYVFAGTQLAKIDSLSGILSPGLIFAFAVLGLFPLAARKVMDKLRANKVYANIDKPEKFDNNLIVIGAGAGGLVSSYIAAAVKAKVTLIEKHKMGGDCLNTGCVPSKAIIRTAKLLSEAQHAPQYGIEKMDAEVDFKSVMNRVHNVIRKIEPHDSVERYTELGVNVIQGEAKIIDPYRVEVNGEVLTTRNIIIGTGARPFVPNIPGLESVDYLTSDTLWDLEELPEKFIVLGGGPIGAELTQAFARLGSNVTMIEREERILIREDEDVSELVLESFNEDKVQVLTQHDAVEVVQKDGQDILLCKHNDEIVEVPFDKLLIAIGRKANISGFGLEELGVEINKNGTITANQFLETNYPNIHVVGDVTGPYQFTHTAAHMAWFASVNALFGFAKRFKVDYRVIPWATFTDPEVSRVGLNEQEAKEKGIEYEVTTYGIDDLDRAIADSADHGFVKVLTPPGKDTILGVTIVGKDSSSLIAEFVLAMKYKLGLNKILGTIHIYPTMAEANKYVAGDWKRKNAPEKLLVWVEKFHTWRRG